MKLKNKTKTNLLISELEVKKENKSKKRQTLICSKKGSKKKIEQ